VGLGFGTCDDAQKTRRVLLSYVATGETSILVTQRSVPVSELVSCLRRLAGSGLSLDQAVCNLAAWTVPPSDAVIGAATANLAASCDLVHRGRIADGQRADFVVSTP